MGPVNAKRFFKDRMIDRGSHRASPTVGQTFQAGVEEVLDLDTTTARVRTQRLYYETQRDDLREMIASGEIPENIVEANRKGRNRNIRWDRLARWSNENLDTEFDTDNEGYNSWMQQRAAEREDLLSYADGWGYLTFMGGGMLGSVADPATLALGVVGAPANVARVGMSAANIVGRRMLFQAGVNAAAEVPLQLVAYDNRKRIGMEYGLTDMGFNLIAAAGLGIPFGLPGVASDLRRLANVDDMINANKGLANYIESWIGSPEWRLEGKFPKDRMLPAMFHELDMAELKTVNNYLNQIEPGTSIDEAEKMIANVRASVEIGEWAKLQEQQSAMVTREAQIRDTAMDGQVTAEELDQQLPEYDAAATTLVESDDGFIEIPLEERMGQVDAEFDSEIELIDNSRVCALG